MKKARRSKIRRFVCFGLMALEDYSICFKTEGRNQSNRETYLLCLPIREAGHGYSNLCDTLHAYSCIFRVYCLIHERKQASSTSAKLYALKHERGNKAVRNEWTSDTHRLRGNE